MRIYLPKMKEYKAISMCPVCRCMTHDTYNKYGVYCSKCQALKREVE
jgi:hypothetical protein